MTSLKKHGIALIVLVLSVLAVITSGGSIYTNSCCSYNTTQSRGVTTTDTVTYHTHIADGNMLAFHLLRNSTHSYGKLDEAGFLDISGFPNFTQSIRTENMSTLFRNLNGQDGDLLSLFIQYWSPSKMWGVRIQVSPIIPKGANVTMDDITKDPADPFGTMFVLFRAPIPNDSITINFDIIGPLNSIVELKVTGFPSLLKPELTTATTTYPISQWSSTGPVFPYQKYTLPLLQSTMILLLAVLIVALAAVQIQERRLRKK